MDQAEHLRKKAKEHRGKALEQDEDIKYVEGNEEICADQLHQVKSREKDEIIYFPEHFHGLFGHNAVNIIGRME